MAYRLIDYITEEWLDLAPAVLGHLLPIVKDLSPGQSLIARYPTPTTVPPVPSLLFELFALRDKLRHSRSLPYDCSAHIQSLSADADIAHRNYQLAFTSSGDLHPYRQHLFDTNMKLCAAIIDTELKLADRNAFWDRVVVLLRGDLFYIEFDFDNHDSFPRTDLIWSTAFDIRNTPM